MTAYNTFDPSKPEMWSQRYQDLLAVKNIARSICSFEEQANLTFGDKVHRPVPADVSYQALTRGNGAYSRASRTDTDESLDVDQWGAVNLVYTKDQEKQMMKFPQRALKDINRSGFRLNRNLDRSILAEVSNASYQTTATSYSKSDIYDGFTAARKEMEDAGVEDDVPWVACVDASVTKLISDFLAGKNTKLGDDATLMGKYGFKQKFADLELFQANQSLRWTAEILIATAPSAAETIVIDGVTFTFVTTIGSVAGNVLIETTAALTIDNLVAAINGASGAGTKYVALSSSDRLKFSAFGETLISATDGTTKVTLTSRKGRITISHTLTASGDGIQNCILHNLFLQKGAIDLVLQSDLETERSKVDSALQYEYTTDMLWGKKTFSEGADRMCDFQILTQANDIES